MSIENSTQVPTNAELRINPEHYDDTILSAYRIFKACITKASKYDPNLSFTEEQYSDFIQIVADAYCPRETNYEDYFENFVTEEMIQIPGHNRNDIRIVTAKASDWNSNLQLTEERLDELIQRVAAANDHQNQEMKYKDFWTSMAPSEIPERLAYKMGISIEEAKKIAPLFLKAMMYVVSWGYIDSDTGESIQCQVSPFSRGLLNLDVYTDVLTDKFIEDNY